MSPQEIFDLLGGSAVLLKIPRGEKRPIDKDWQNRTTADNNFDGWNGANIGVSLGAPSNFLCTIDWDSDELARTFWSINLGLRKTLMSRADRGCNFWLRIVGDYPKSCKIKLKDGGLAGEWRADGMQTVIDGIHPSGKEYKKFGDIIVEIAFDAILWPDAVIRPGYVPPPAPEGFDDGAIIARVGPALYFDQFGNLTKVNGQYFIERFCVENYVLFEQDEGAFFRYVDAIGAWCKVVAEVIKEMAREDYQRLTIEWDVAQMARKASNGMFNQATNGVQSLAGRTQVFKPLKRTIHCANGMLHLLEGGEELRVFHPDYFARNPTPIAWAPSAKAPKFQAILDTMEPADADLLLRYAANVLLGGNPSQQILLLTGEGGTSKSTVCELIELVVGRRNVAELRTEHLDNRFEIGRYLGKTLLSGKDVRGNFLQQEGAARIKALTGHDMLTGEIKKEMGTPEIYGQFAVIITCNERLTVKLEGETDMSAWSRRLMHIEFSTKSKHKEIIPDYAKKLYEEEGEGILVLIVKAAFRHLKELETIGTFYQTPRQKGRIDDLLAESRSIELFVKECVFAQKGSDISSDELVNAYNRYCEGKGWEPFAAPLFQRYVVNHMVRCHKSNKGTHCQRDVNGQSKRVNGYPNVTLIEDNHQQQDQGEFPDYDTQ